MILHHFNQRETNGRVRISADITWEDSKRPTRTLWYETETKYAEGFSLSADPFLMTSYTLACLYGEQRVHVKELPICPVQTQQLPGISPCWKQTHSISGLTVPRITSSEQIFAELPPANRKTVHYISGGVDALASLSRWHPSHNITPPYKPEECLCIFGLYGFDCPNGEIDIARFTAWQRLRDRMESLIEPMGMSLVTAHTNVRNFFQDFNHWSIFAHPIAHASVAHAFRDRWSHFYIATHGGSPHGLCHVPSYAPDLTSSASMTYRTDWPTKERFERIQELCCWDDALSALQPCHGVEILPNDQINCGYCEKCVRTMLDLLVLDKLEKSPFPKNITPQMIMSLNLAGSDAKIRFLRDSIPRLNAFGRKDLSIAIRRKTRKIRWKKWKKTWLQFPKPKFRTP